MMATEMEIEMMSCPRATQDITLNLKNRGEAIDSANYGPENPKLPNSGFWREMASEWDVSTEEAKTARCGNCAAFNRSPQMLQCIAKGVGSEGDPWATIEAGDLGYCEIFDFKCAASRTCRAWVAKEDEDYEDEEGEDEEYMGKENAKMEGEDYEE
jgi:hypothetical protein